MHSGGQFILKCTIKTLIIFFIFIILALLACRPNRRNKMTSCYIYKKILFYFMTIHYYFICSYHYSIPNSPFTSSVSDVKYKFDSDKKILCISLA